MNSYRGEVRKRSQNLLIVEGHHEKNKLFDDIVKEYGEEWAKEHEDIDLPFVISKKAKMLC